MPSAADPDENRPVGTVGGVEPQGPYFPLRVARVDDETHDSRSIVLDVPSELAATFAYKAGQFLTFRTEVDGKTLTRCYSLASSPDVDAEHKVTVKRVEGGRVSNWMNERVSAGDVLQVMRPAGLFCLKERDTPLVLFGGGSGITPVISIIKTALVTTSRPVELLYANRDTRSVIFAAELEKLVGAHANRLRVEHRLDDRDGFATEDVIRDFVAAPNADFYVCGPGPFMDVVENALRGLGVERDRIFIERFVSPPDDGASAPEPDPAEDAGEATPDTVHVSLDGQQRDVPYSPGKTVLEAVREAGMDPPFACEEGYCGCCMAKLRDGQVRMRANDCLDQAQLDEGWVLTCQSVPTSRTCKVEYPD
ncbi:MAG: ferredoxin--NADP reductase [Proteobacteria bacterium]|nr:ferredoxin--NADP reductase [Pseudomonadota bacterium]